MADSLEALVARLLALATVDESGARRLPPERVLCDELGMSRGALREQFSVLERLGFLHRTQGRGTYLDTPSYDFVRSFFAISRSLGYITDQHVADSRVLVEEAVAESAARRATPDQIADLREALERMAAGEEAGDDSLIHQADVDFHRRLLDIVDNPVLQFLREGLSRALDDDMRARRDFVERGHSSLDFDRSHENIVEAIEARDPEAARLGMRRHFGITATDATAPGFAGHP
ncbi:FadR/GntR family transcriptional regulator [Microbacterium sp. CFBP9034]|uniref:FadR/GntR family transcriptional regulator n=1 Tax=Microbacterium sp. CFBP9034 TaxID=3096540 RepID=UPI002A6AB4C5|nr:FCD domain-containing protein [Microbacterium sp. CFBP9034]MDY0908395.1 FCD domain-containing protein [Microbacterium sp. CFBP9034]